MSMKENEIDRILADLVAGERISAEDRQILENWKEVSGRNSALRTQLLGRLYDKAISRKDR